MPLNTSDLRVVFAIDTLRLASELARNVQASSGSLGLTKPDASPVTVADFAVQAIVARTLSQVFPGSVLVGEESSDALRDDANREVLNAICRFVGAAHAKVNGADICQWIDSGRGEATGSFWTLDPIDGTKGFLRKEQYAIAIAQIEDGHVVFGALACPNLNLSGSTGAILVAARGQGCYLVPDPGQPAVQLFVSAISEPAQIRLLRSVETGHTNISQIDRIAERLRITAAPVPMDSQAKYAALSMGAGDAILRLLSPKKLDYKECIWDQAAGAIIVEEAGGKVTDLFGKRLDFGYGKTLEANTGVCVSNGRIHDALIEAVAATNPA